MIMIVINSMTGGGAERSMNVLSRALSDLREPVHLVGLNYSEPDLIFPNCTQTCLDRAQNSGLRETLKTFLDFCKLVHRVKPSIIVLNCDLPELFGALLPFRVKLIGIEHAPIPFGKRKTLGFFIRCLLFIRGTKWVSVSQHLRIWPFAKKPSRVLLNALPLYCFKRINSTPHQISRIVFIGRLVNPQKYPEICIDIAKKVDRPLLFIGQGPERDKLVKYAEKLKVDARFSGFVANPWELIQNGDLIVVPSRFEGDGMVVVEAVLHNVRILMSNIPDLLRFGFPELIYCDSADTFAKRIQECIDGKINLELPAKFLESLSSERDPAVVALAWREFIRELDQESRTLNS